MSTLLAIMVWGVYAAAIFFVWAYIALWGMFAFGVEWMVGVVVAVAITVGGFKLARNLV